MQNNFLVSENLESMEVQVQNNPQQEQKEIFNQKNPFSEFNFLLDQSNEPIENSDLQNFHNLSKMMKLSKSDSLEQKKFIKNLVDNATFFESQYYPLFVENQSLKDQLIVVKNRIKDRTNDFMNLTKNESSSGDDRKLVKHLGELEDAVKLLTEDMNDLRIELSQKEYEKNQLSNTITNLNAFIDELRNQNEEKFILLKNEHLMAVQCLKQTYKSQLQQYIEESLKINTQNQDYEQIIKSRDQSIRNLQHEYASLKQSYKVVETDGLGQIQYLKNLQQKTVAQLYNLKKKFEENESQQLEDLKTSQQFVLNQFIEKQQIERTQAKEQLDMKAKEFQILQEEYRTYKDKVCLELQDFRELKKDHQKESLQNQQKISQLKKTIKEIEQKLPALDKQNKEIMDQKINIQTKFDALMIEFDDFQVKADLLQKKLQNEISCLNQVIIEKDNYFEKTTQDYEKEISRLCKKYEGEIRLRVQGLVEDYEEKIAKIQLKFEQGGGRGRRNMNNANEQSAETIQIDRIQNNNSQMSYYGRHDTGNQRNQNYEQINEYTYDEFDHDEFEGERLKFKKQIAILEEEIKKWQSKLELMEIELLESRGENRKKLQSLQDEFDKYKKSQAHVLHQEQNRNQIAYQNIQDKYEQQIQDLEIEHLKTVKEILSRKNQEMDSQIKDKEDQNYKINENVQQLKEQLQREFDLKLEIYKQKLEDQLNSNYESSEISYEENQKGQKIPKPRKEGRQRNEKQNLIKVDSNQQQNISQDQQQNIAQQSYKQQKNVKLNQMHSKMVATLNQSQLPSESIASRGMKNEYSLHSIEFVNDESNKNILNQNSKLQEDQQSLYENNIVSNTQTAQSNQVRVPNNRDLERENIVLKLQIQELQSLPELVQDMRDDMLKLTLENKERENELLGQIHLLNMESQDLKTQHLKEKHELQLEHQNIIKVMEREHVLYSDHLLKEIEVLRNQNLTLEAQTQMNQRQVREKYEAMVDELLIEQRTFIQQMRDEQLEMENRWFEEKEQINRKRSELENFLENRPSRNDDVDRIKKLMIDIQCYKEQQQINETYIEEQTKLANQMKMDIQNYKQMFNIFGPNHQQQMQQQINLHQQPQIISLSKIQSNNPDLVQNSVDFQQNKAQTSRNYQNSQNSQIKQEYEKYSSNASTVRFDQSMRRHKRIISDVTDRNEIMTQRQEKNCYLNSLQQDQQQDITLISPIRGLSPYQIELFDTKKQRRIFEYKKRKNQLNTVNKELDFSKIRPSTTNKKTSQPNIGESIKSRKGSFGMDQDIDDIKSQYLNNGSNQNTFINQPKNSNRSNF